MTATLPNPFTLRERSILRPRSRLLPVDWAERNVVVGRDSPVPGCFSRQTMPILTSPMNSLLDPRYQEIAAVASTQSGKSQSMNQILLGYSLEHARRHTAFGIANRKIAQRVYKTKLKPMFEAVPVLSALLPHGGAGSRGGFPTEQILQNGALWLFLGAGSAADMSQATVEYLIVDETDKADEEAESGKEANPLEQMIRRTDAHQLTRRIVYTCTPTVKKGFIWQKYLDGTEGKPWFRCPECGEWFWFEWSWENQRIGWDDDTSEVSALETAFYPCPKCGKKIREEERLSMLRFPLWVHAGESIESCTIEQAESAGIFEEAVVIPGSPRKAFRVTGTRKATRTVSFWWNRLCSPFTTLGHMATDLRKSREEESKRHAVAIYDMALPYESRILDASEISIETLLEHMRFSSYSSGRAGRMPFRYDPKTVCVTCGIDIGKRELYAVVDAWLVDAEKFVVQSYRLWMMLPYAYPNPGSPRGIFDGLEAMREICLQGWLDSEGNPFKINGAAIDTGYQDSRSQRQRLVAGADYQVYEFCRRYGQGTWRAVKGSAQPLDTGMIFKASPMEEAGVMLWLLDTDSAKVEVHEQLRVRPGENGFWHLPQDTTREYARGMCSEKRIVSFDAHGREKAEWVREDPFNHPFDASVYSWAMARILGVRPPRGRSIEPKKEGKA